MEAGYTDFPEIFYYIDSIHFKLSDFLSPKFERMEVQEGQTFDFGFTWDALAMAEPDCIWKYRVSDC